MKIKFGLPTIRAFFGAGCLLVSFEKETVSIYPELKWWGEEELRCEFADPLTKEEIESLINNPYIMEIELDQENFDFLAREFWSWNDIWAYNTFQIEKIEENEDQF